MGVDEECAVERLFFEVIVGVVFAEDVAVRISEKFEGNALAIFDVGFLRFLEFGDGIGAEGEDIETSII